MASWSREPLRRRQAVRRPLPTIANVGLFVQNAPNFGKDDGDYGVRNLLKGGGIYRLAQSPTVNARATDNARATVNPREAGYLIRGGNAMARDGADISLKLPIGHGIAPRPRQWRRPCAHRPYPATRSGQFCPRWQGTCARLPNA